MAAYFSLDFGIPSFVELFLRQLPPERALFSMPLQRNPSAPLFTDPSEAGLTPPLLASLQAQVNSPLPSPGVLSSLKLFFLLPSHNV